VPLCSFSDGCSARAGTGGEVRKSGEATDPCTERSVQEEFLSYCARQGTHRILKSKQHQMNLIDGSAVIVQIDFHIGYGRLHDYLIRSVYEVPLYPNNLLDVGH